MKNSGNPEGQRFSHVYIQRGAPIQDSARMRRRLGSLVKNNNGASQLAEHVEQELGITGPWSGVSDWIGYLAQWELQDVLDFVTIAYRFYTREAKEDYRLTYVAANWLPEVRRIFQEENVQYRIDNIGGVHFYLDEEFTRNYAATLSALNGPRYANALHLIEAGFDALSKAPPDVKQAIRQTFAAAEGLFRLMYSDAPRLTAKELEKLRPAIQEIYTTNPTALGAANKLLGSFKEWVEGAHFYRHEAGSEEVAQPPLNLAIYFCSAGAAHLRWLAEIDRFRQSKSIASS